MLIIEELTMQELTARGAKGSRTNEEAEGFPIRIHTENTEADGVTSLEITWGGEPFDPLADGNQISAVIVRHLTEEVKYTYEDRNRIRATLR